MISLSYFFYLSCCYFNKYKCFRYNRQTNEHCSWLLKYCNTSQGIMTFFSKLRKQNTFLLYCYTVWPQSPNFSQCCWSKQCLTRIDFLLEKFLICFGHCVHYGCSEFKVLTVLSQIPNSLCYILIVLTHNYFSFTKFVILESEDKSNLNVTLQKESENCKKTLKSLPRRLSTNSQHSPCRRHL